VLGLNFLNPVFLAGLAAAALPILIHLFSRRRARVLSFPSLEYLQEISRRKVRRMRLRQWLLLALRVLIVAFFAMAMGRPAIRGGAGVVTRGSSTVAVVLDNSFSMSAADPRRSGESPPLDDAPPAGGVAGTAAGGLEAGTLFDESGTVYQSAKERVFEILDLMSEGDRGILALPGRPVTVPFVTPVADVGLLRQEVRRAPLAAEGADLPAALAQVIPILASARTMNRELFIVSDFQQRDLESWLRTASDGGRVSTGGMAAAEATVPDVGTAPRGMGTTLPGGGTTPLGRGTANDIVGALVKIPAGIHVYLISARTASLDNASVARMRYDPAAGLGGKGQLVTTVVNHGEDPVTDRPVRVTAGGPSGDVLADAVFDLPPGGRGDARADLSGLPSDGALAVRLGSDALELDNTGYLVTGDPGVRKVLLVIGGSASAAAGESGAVAVGGTTPPGDAVPAGNSRADEGRFLRTALDPDGTSEFFSVRETDPDGLAAPEGLSADVVILSSVGRLSAAAVENLVAFRARGGGILIGLGDRVDPRYYNTDILPRLLSVELLNVSQEEGEGAFRSLRPIVLAHPIFSGFPIGPGDDLGSARFRRLVTCRTGQDARVLAEFGRGNPAIVEGDGVLLFTSSLDGGWNDFVFSASYPPLLHKMVRHLATRGAGDDRAGLVGARLEVTLPESEVNNVVSCVDPSGTQTPVEATPLEQMVRLRSVPAPWPGIYRFRDAAGRTLASFAVNLDPAEGDLRVATPELQSRFFGRDAKRLDPEQRVTRELLAGRYGRELWRPFLVMVLVLLAVESVLGRGRLLG
jgi:hypothetical protein